MGIITNKIYIYTSSEKNVVDNIEIDYVNPEEGTIKLPIYRAMYLEKLFKENHKLWRNDE